MATTKDAEVGWELFRDSDYSLSLTEINDELARLGYGKVSKRMYSHYRKLRRLGYELYIPINQLDVKTLADPVWGKAVRGRYLPLPIDISVALRIYVGDDAVLLRGIASEVSDGEALVVLRGPEALAFFDEAKATDRNCDFIVEATGEVVEAKITRVTVSSESGTVAVRMLFEEFDAVARVTNLPSAPVAELSLIFGQGSGDTLAELAQDTYWLFQAVEAMRVAAQDLLDVMGGSGQVALSPPRVRRLRKGSIDIAIDGPQAVMAASAALVLAIAEGRRRWYEAELARQDGLERRWRNEEAGIDTAGVVKRCLRIISSRLASQTALEAPDLDSEDLERARSAIERQAVPATKHIVGRSSDDPRVLLDGESPRELEDDPVPDLGPGLENVRQLRPKGLPPGE